MAQNYTKWRTFFAFMLLNGIVFQVGAAMNFKITSSAFKTNGNIPSVYTCDGKNVSPPLAWEFTPARTQSYVLIIDDPDSQSGLWDHWLLANIPLNVNSLSENIHKLPHPTLVGKNSWNHQKYDGPCPPDKMHRYSFQIYALDTLLPLQNGFSRKELNEAMKGHILRQAALLGHYERNH